MCTDVCACARLRDCTNPDPICTRVRAPYHMTIPMASSSSSSSSVSSMRRIMCVLMLVLLSSSLVMADKLCNCRCAVSGSAPIARTRDSTRTSVSRARFLIRRLPTRMLLTVAVDEYRAVINVRSIVNHTVRYIH